MTAVTPTLIRHHTPKYRHHKATGQAYVELGGRRIYLGAYALAESREKYHRLVAEWEAGNRRWAVAPEQISIAEVIEGFWQHAKSAYRRPDGTTTTELESYRQALRPLKALYGSESAAVFGPRALKAVRQEMTAAGWARTHINKQVSRLKTVFRWATEEELIPPSVFHALQAVRGLQRGRTEARETEPVKPVPDDLIAAIKPYVSRQVWAMIQVQLLTGCRPDEAIRLRGVDFTNTREEVWLVHYDEHKTARFGINKTIFFGPQARAVVAPFLEGRPINAYLFSAAEAEQERRERLHAQRQTPMSCGNIPGSNRNPKPARSAGDRYTVSSYRRAITRACDEAFPPPEDLQRHNAAGEAAPRPETDAAWKQRLGNDKWAGLRAWQRAHRWSPNRLRHNAATHLRHEFGIDVAQTVLGHQLGSRITELYAEPNVLKAMQAIRKVG